MDNTDTLNRSLTDLGAEQTAQLIRNGEASAREVVEATIGRIEEVDQKLNALPIRLFEQALEAADAADQARTRGLDLGSLHGVPITIKEQFRVHGTPTTCGYTSEMGKIYADEGPMVTSLRDAGAIILGKTNIMQALSGWECDNPVYGRTNNPWDLARTPGGSSGGEGALIAAGGSTLGLASDLGGSIRFPAYFCGVHGFKPTSGLLTNEDMPIGIFSLGQETILAQPGPIARRVEDLSLAMSVLSRSEPDFVISPPVGWAGPASVDVSKLRIGYYTDNEYFPASPAIRRAVEEAANWLRAAGAEVVEMRPPDTEEGMRIFVAVFSSDGSVTLKRELGEDRPVAGLRSTVQGASIPTPMRPALAALMERWGQGYMADLIRAAGPRSAAEYWELVEARSVYRGRYLAELDRTGVDAILSPPFAVPAPLHESTEHLIPAGSYALVYNVLGMPVGIVSTTRVQAGEESDRESVNDKAVKTARQVEQNSVGLPVGVQVAARHWRDDIVLAVMGEIERRARESDTYPLHPTGLS
jgi:fatty acid amide hydrolase